MGVAHEWGRFVWWLNENSGAIQAASSVLTFLVAAYLVRFNVRATEAAQRSYEAANNQFQLGQRQFQLSERQFELSEKQFAMALRPKLVVQVGYTPNVFHVLNLSIQNVGTDPARVDGVFIELEWTLQSETRHVPDELLIGAPFVLAPNETVERQYTFDELISSSIEAYGSISTERLHLAVCVNCSDLAVGGKHCFTRDTYGRAFYSDSFFLLNKAIQPGKMSL